MLPPPAPGARSRNRLRPVCAAVEWRTSFSVTKELRQPCPRLRPSASHGTSRSPCSSCSRSPQRRAARTTRSPAPSSTKRCARAARSIASGRRRGLLPRHGRRRVARRRRRSRAATCGSSGPAATTASGTCSRVDSLGALDFLKTISSHPDAAATAATTAGTTSGWSTSRASEGRPARSEPLRPLARRARSDCPPDPFANADEVSGRRRSARAARPCPSAPTTASRPASSACGCSRTRTSTRRRARSWDSERYYTRPELLRLDATSSGRTASACRAGSATSARIRSSRRPIRRTRSGRTSARTSARSTSGSTAIFDWKATTNGSSFVFQLLHTSRPGTLDTSLVSTDNINNPRTMNAVY